MKRHLISRLRPLSNPPTRSSSLSFPSFSSSFLTRTLSLSLFRWTEFLVLALLPISTYFNYKISAKLKLHERYLVFYFLCCLQIIAFLSYVNLNNFMLHNYCKICSFLKWQRGVVYLTLRTNRQYFFSYPFIDAAQSLLSDGLVALQCGVIWMHQSRVSAELLMRKFAHSSVIGERWIRTGERALTTACRDKRLSCSVQ